MSSRGTQNVWDELREQGRAMVGALLVVGTTFVYTMESWWLGWTLPAWLLLTYAIVGLGVVLAITRSVSFRESEQGQVAGDQDSILSIVTDFAELVLQSVVAAYVMLLVFGVIEFGEPRIIVARLILIEIVPLGFGAALANKLLSGEKEDTKDTLRADLATFAIGALFIASTIALTEEMAMIAAYMNWTRAAVMIVLTLLVVYLMLYELNTQGQTSRLQGRGNLMRYGQAFLVYGVGLTVGFFLLAGFGYVTSSTIPVTVQLLVVVGFPASLGASAAEVVVG